MILWQSYTLVQMSLREVWLQSTEVLWYRWMTTTSIEDSAYALRTFLFFEICCCFPPYDWPQVTITHLSHIAHLSESVRRFCSNINFSFFNLEFFPNVTEYLISSHTISMLSRLQVMRILKASTLGIYLERLWNVKTNDNKRSTAFTMEN